MLALERNLRLVAVHEVLVHTAPWMVVLTLFNWARFDVDGAVALSAVYYLAVVALEVPSGWASDRFGRVVTLRFVGLAWIGAYLCWLIFDASYLAMAAGNVLIAAGYASVSGTDVSLHYDTLEALNRAHEFADRQARIVAFGRGFGSIGAIAGGSFGLIDLKIPFLLSIVLAAGQLVLTLRMVEPPRKAHADPLLGQVRRCLAYLANLPIRWMFVYGVGMVVLEHVAINLFTPWLALALNQTPEQLGETPVIAGLVLAVTGIVGAGAARMATSTARRVGVRVTLMGLAVLSAVIVTAMAASQHVVIIWLIVLRSIHGSSAPILISAAVAPHVQQQHRATLLSLNSLGGRALWGSLLLGIASVSDSVTTTLASYATISWVLVVGLGLFAVVVHRHHGPTSI